MKAIDPELIAQTLLKQSDEIAQAGHNGWGNTMRLAAELIGTLVRERDELKARLERLGSRR